LSYERIFSREGIDRPEDLDREDLARLVMDMFHRTIIHHALWFSETERQFGLPRALDIMDNALRKTVDVQMTRLSKTLGFEMANGIPGLLLDMSEDDLQELIKALAINWLAGDGIWFQAIEFSSGMYDAQRCNDSCWVRFSPFEAWSVKRLLGLPEQAGIDGLKKALRFRMYANINVQSIEEEESGGIVFKMVDCRVQSARKRKGLPDYPCKSAGLVEYRTFASAIDERIHTECIGCPPDDHPGDWWCAWRFSIAGE